MKKISLHERVYSYRGITMRDNGHGLTIHVNFMVKCVRYMGRGSNGCFVTGAALMGSHYKTYIICDVGHLMSDLVMLLVL